MQRNVLASPRECTIVTRRLSRRSFELANRVSDADNSTHTRSSSPRSVRLHALSCRPATADRFPLAAPRFLSRAPITEALIDIRATVGSSCTPARLLDAKRLLRDSFPVAKDQKATQVAVETGRDFAATTTDLGLRGVFLYSKDELDVVQFRMDGFTFNRLKPYTRWEQILPLALEAFSTFVALTEPTAVTRIAVRYINHVPVSGTHRDALTALHTGLALPADLPGDFRSYGFKAQLDHPDGRTHANLVQAVESGLRPGTFSVLIDIDVYRNAPELPMTTDELAREFESLREYKNQIFFSTLTDATADDLT